MIGDIDIIKTALGKSSNGKSYLNTPYSHRPPIVICDGVKTRSVEFAKMCHELSSKYRDHSVKIKDGVAITGSAISGNLNQVLQDSSYLSNPLSSVVPTGIMKIEDDDYRKILTNVAYLYGQCWEFPPAIRVNKKSRSGFPQDTFELDEKVMMWLKVYNQLDLFIDDLKRLVDRSMTQRTFFQKWDAAFVKLEGRRYQETDKISWENGQYVPRQREVYDWNGKKVTQNRMINFYPKDLPMFSIRDRLLWRFSLVLTIFSNLYAEGNRRAIKAKYPLAQIHIHRNLVKDMMSDGFNHIWAGDIKNMDQNTPLESMEIYFRKQAYMPDFIQEAHLMYAHAPSMIKNTYLDKLGLRMIGDLGYIDDKLYNGHPTGYAYVSNFNEANGYAVSFTVLHKAGLIDAHNVGEIAKVLNGLNPRFRLKCKGDDNIITFRNADDRAKIAKVYEEWNSPYTLVEEAPAKFLGALFTDSGTIQANIDSRNFIVKFLVPEKSATHLQNLLWKLGWSSRYSEYLGPGAIEMQVELRSALLKHFNIDIESPTFTTLNARESARYKELLLKATNLADLLFLQDSSYIYKRDGDTEVSDKIIAEEFLSLPASVLTKFHKYIGG